MVYKDFIKQLAYKYKELMLQPSVVHTFHMTLMFLLHEGMTLPPTWTQMKDSDSYISVPLHAGHPEYQEVAQRFSREAGKYCKIIVQASNSLL